MRSNCTLVSSCVLFVSVVLAGYHPEKQQPPLLDHVEKSLNTTADLQYHNAWGGGLWQARQWGQKVDLAIGRFTVPRVIYPAAPNSEFNIAVGLRGYTSCPDFTLGVGINVKITEDGNGVSYKFRGQWTSHIVRTKTPSEEEYPISVGNEITAIVWELTPTSGIYLLINHTRVWVWAGHVKGWSNDCKQDAAWVVSSTPEAQHLSLPNFQALSFTRIRANIDGVLGVPSNLIGHDLELHGQVKAVTEFKGDWIVIMYVP